MIKKIDAQSWAKDTLVSLGYVPQGESQIVREVPWSQVYRFDTPKGRVFLKYMDSEFALEPALLKYLREHVTGNVTDVIAINKQLSCFLMKDAGEPLRPMFKAEFDLELFDSALTLCADIQISCIPHVERLIALGVNDWRLDKIPGLYEGFLKQKTMLIADGLKDSEIKILHDLIPTMQSLCETLKVYDIPETIEHCDFHDNNVLLKEGSFIINDWGDACISHPFFSCVSSLESARRNHQLSDVELEQARLKYLEQWKTFGTEDELLEVFALARKIRYFLFALSFSRIKSCPEIDKFPQFNGYIAGAMRDFIKSTEEASYEQ